MGVFLSAEEIVQAVEDGQIRIAYYAVSAQDDGVKAIGSKRLVKVSEAAEDDELDVLIRNFFLNSLEPDSIALHVGPYALVESLQRSPKEIELIERNNQRVLPISQAGFLDIMPGEFVLIGSNEYVETSQNIGASLYSNVRNTDIGLSHVSTMIDPSWKGVLQVGVSNATSATKRLRYLDALCVVRFHRLEQTPPPDVVDRFRGRRPHYANDWWAAESETGRSFFPLRKEYSLGGEFDKRVRAEKRSRQFWGAAKNLLAVVGVTAIATVIFFLGKLYKAVEDTTDYRERILTLEAKQQILDDMANTFHVIETGSHAVQFDERGEAEFVIPFREPVSQLPVVLVNVVGMSSNLYSVETDYRAVSRSSALYSSVSVLVGLQGADDVPKDEVMVSWLLARPRSQANTRRN